MLFLYFFAFTYGYTYRKAIANNEFTHTLPEFGFKENGRFEISLTGRNITGTIVLLVDRNQLRDLKKTKIESICLYPKDLTLYTHFVVDDSTLYKPIRYKVKKKGIYFPIVCNCKGKSFFINAVCKNGDSHIDARENLVPEFCIGFSLLYSVFVIVWIFDMLLHPEFDIILPKLFALCCAIKSLSLTFNSSNWDYVSDNGEPSTKYYLLARSTNFTGNIMLIVINILASYGLGIYRREVTGSEAFDIIMNCIAFFSSKFILRITNNFLLFIVAAFYCYVDIVILTKTITKGMYLNASLYETSSNDTQLRLKSKLAIVFSGTFFTVFVIVSFCSTSGYAFTSINPSLSLLCDETIVTFIMLIDLDFFLIKKEYLPHRTHIDSEEDFIDPNGISIVEEPGETEYAFITAL